MRPTWSRKSWRTPWRSGAAALALLAAVAVPLAAHAHPLGQKPVLLVAPTATGFGASWIVAEDDARALAEHLELGPVRLDTMHEHAAFRAYLRARLRLRTTSPCEASVLPVERVPTGFAIQAGFTCTAAEVLTVRLTLLHDIDDRYQTHYQVRARGRVARGLLTVSSPVARVDLRAATATAPPVPPTAEGRGLFARISASVEGQAGAAPFALALLFALALGAFHAVTPGHGKTLTAAYIVGAGGTARHGVMLGGVVALAHAGGTIVLGAAAIATDRLLLPSEMGPWFQLAAGVLIIGIAPTLLRVRVHAHEPRAAPTVGRLAAVGLIGGLVPSPDAVAIVLVAFSLERWIAGAALIAAFSIGLAAVVLGVAVTAARGGSFMRARLGERFVRYAPRAAGAIFLGLGVVIVVNAVRAL